MFRARICFSIIAWSICSFLVHADDDAKTIVRKAIDAHGGADVLNKYPAAKVKIKGTMALLGQMVPFTSTATYQMPDKMKETQSVQFGGVTRNVTQLQVGDKVHIFIDGKETKVEDKDLPKYKEMIHVQNLYRLTPLLDIKVCKISLVDDSVVAERPARGVKATSEGHKDITFYFDKGTNMLVKTQRMGFDPKGVEAPIEEFYSGYKDVKGYMYPTKTSVMIRGSKFLDSDTLEFLPLEKFESSEFEKP